MSFRDLLRDTLVTLWAQKRRTLLTMFGIAWGIISITIMVAAGEGLGAGIQKNQETFGKDVMIVFAGRTSMQAGGTRSGRLIRWLEDDYIQVAKESPACKYVMPELGNDAQVRSLFNSGTIPVVGHFKRFAASPHSRAVFTTIRITKKPATSPSSAAMSKNSSLPKGKRSARTSG